jgi:DNA-binding transcriptional ArsR family regulator
MPQQTLGLDRVFHALADPTRRAVVERLGTGPAGTSELARPFEMALPSFIQHLDVLEAVGLVASTKEGRVRTYRLTPKPLEAAQDWLAAQRELWERRLDQFDEYVRTLSPDNRPTDDREDRRQP